MAASGQRPLKCTGNASLVSRLAEIWRVLSTGAGILRLYGKCIGTAQVDCRKTDSSEMKSMDQKAIEEAARAAAAAGIHVGHVFVRHEGDDMHIKCTSCGVEEVVKNYGNGTQPQKFVYQPTRMDGREYVKCESCYRVHDRVIPHAR